VARRPGSRRGDGGRATLAALRDGPGIGVPLLDAAAAGARRWLGLGGTRPPLRAALVRFWVEARVLRAPLPLIRWFEVVQVRGDVADGKVAHDQVTLKLGFTLEKR
jgi:Dodecin